MTHAANVQSVRRSHADFHSALVNVLYESERPLKEQAYLLGIPESTMRGWASESSRNSLKAEDVARVTIVSGNPAILEQQAGQSGYMVVKLLDTARLPVDVAKEFIRSIRDTSDVADVALQQLESGKINRDTAALVDARVHRIISMLLSISAAVTAAAGCSGCMA